MAERINLSKKTRFEVFKRDKFTCQYCGRMAPDVILEVDHMKPVADGGDNNIINLITSCRDCNRGKGKNLLSNDNFVKKQQAQLLDLADKREQTEMIIEWRKELQGLIEIQVEAIDDYIFRMTGCNLNEYGKKDIKSYIRRFSFIEVYDAIEIAFDLYYDMYRERSFSNAISKIGGICYNKRKEKGDNNGNIQNCINEFLD